MRILLILTLGIVYSLFGTASAGDISIHSDDSSLVDITALFSESEIPVEPLGRIAEFFYRDFELRSSQKPYNVALIMNESDDTAHNNSGRYIVKFDILQSGWKVNLAFHIPMFIFVYTKNYEIVAQVKLYDRKSADPEMIKKYNVSNEGARVLQFIDNDPNVGGLMIPYTAQQVLELETEKLLAEKLSKDIHDKIKKRGG